MISRLHLVTDDRVLARSDFPDACGAAVAAGGERVAVHLRGPSTSGSRLAALGEALLPRCREAGAGLLANDRVDLALALGLDGAHLGGRSLPVGTARAILGEGAWLGRSVHGAVEARAADTERAGGRGVDFVLVGTVFSTPSHPGWVGGGADLIHEVVDVMPGVPVIGIGGVTRARVATVLSAGAHGVAVVRSVWDAPEPAEAVRELLDAIDEAENGGGRG